jgi:putative cell wall-binding protein
VNGRLTSPDAETIAELRRSGVTKVEVVGGAAAISQGFADGLSAAGFTVQRVAGADRFATSVAITADAFPGVGQAPEGAVGALRLSETAVIASGLNFPDALAGAALAGKLGAPLLIATNACLPPDALGAMEDIGVKKVVVIGGTAGLSGALDRLATCR